MSKNINWDAGVEKIIKKNLLIGNFEGAIDCSLKCGRVAEALLLAYSTSEMLFDSTAKGKYFNTEKNLWKIKINKFYIYIKKKHFSYHPKIYSLKMFSKIFMKNKLRKLWIHMIWVNGKKL